MRNTLAGIVVGLILGAMGALGYSHFLGADSQLAQVQADLSEAKADSAKAREKNTQTAKETAALSTQVQELTAAKQELKQQLDTAKAPDAAPPVSNAMAGLMKAGMDQRSQEQLFLLKKRLHLTPEQEVTVKAAIEVESKRGEAIAEKLFSGQKIDPKSFSDLKGAKSVDQTLDEVLNPDQKTAYQQMKTEQKSSGAEMVANTELNQVSPLLQLNDTQKDQAYNALYQVQMDTQNPDWIEKNVPDLANNPVAIIDAQAKAKETALAKILTPDQLATYHQQMQSQLDMQKAAVRGLSPSSGAVSTQVIVQPAGP